MGALAINFGQDVSLLPREVGVGFDHVDSEGNFVLNPLTWAMSARKQFQIFWGVLCTIAVFMMDGFFGKKFATKDLFHNVAMFKHGHLLASLGRERRDGQPHIAMTLNVATNFSGFESPFSLVHLPRNFAFMAAKFLLMVDSAARFTALILNSPALYTGKKVARVSFASFVCAEALAGTKEWIVMMHLAVCREIARLHAKLGAAHFARELYFIFSGRGSAVSSFVRGSAGARAKFVPVELGRLYLESIAAFTANLFHDLRNSKGLVVTGLYTNMGVRQWQF